MSNTMEQDRVCQTLVREQLERTIKSSDFCRSERLSRFLRFIVEEWLEGRSERLKAYTIALAVFDRPSSFDPQSDPLVRIEATRLRRALEHYYLTDGKQDPLLISVPKGAYIPQFVALAERPEEEACAAPPGESRPVDVDVPAEAARPGRPKGALAVALAAVVAVVALMPVLGMVTSPNAIPSQNVPTVTAMPALAVLPFRSTGADEEGKRVADGLDDALIDQLARLGDLRVLGRETSQLAHSAPLQFNEPTRFNVRYFVEGSLTSQHANAMVSVRLLEAAQRQVVWSTRIPVTLSSDVAAAQAEVAAIIARTLAQPYGALYRIEAARFDRGFDNDALASACISSFFRYRLSISAEGNRSVGSCLEETVKRTPSSATAWAMLALVHLDGLRFGLTDGQHFSVIVKRASEAAERAVELEPENIRALQAAMLSRFFTGDVERGRVAGEKALAINPFDTEVLSEYGTRIAQAGEWGRGARMLEAALAQNPPNAGVLHGHAAFAMLMDGRIDQAAAHLRKLKLDAHPSVLFVQMLVHAESGDMRAARLAFGKLKRLDPSFLPDIDRELGVRNISGADLDRIKSILQRVQTTTVAAYSE